MYMKLKDGKSKVFTLSFDDCVVQDIRFVELIDKYGIKCTFNINTGLYLPEDEVRERFYGRMKKSEAIELYKNSNHEVAVHGLTHPFLERLKSEEMCYEILEDRKNIENQYDIFARGMAYPYGTYSRSVIEVLEKCGICYSRTILSTEDFKFPQNWLELHPTCKHNNPRLMNMAKRFVENKGIFISDNWMFYVWGHTFELDDENYWDKMEEFLKYVSGKEDVWYATNIEIYDYVKAYENLQVSVDRKVVYNPSVIDVWFAENNKIYCVKGGETVRI